VAQIFCGGEAGNASRRKGFGTNVLKGHSIAALAQGQGVNRTASTNSPSAGMMGAHRAGNAELCSPRADHTGVKKQGQNEDYKPFGREQDWMVATNQRTQRNCRGSNSVIRPEVTDPKKNSGKARKGGRPTEQKRVRRKKAILAPRNYSNPARRPNHGQKKKTGWPARGTKNPEFQNFWEKTIAQATHPDA